MRNSQIHAFLLEGCVFYRNLLPKKQRKFLQTVGVIYRKKSIEICFVSQDEEQIKLSIAAVCARFLFSSFDHCRFDIFKGIRCYQDEFPDDCEQIRNRFFIPIRICSDDLMKTATYDFAYGYYQCYLMHPMLPEYFAGKIGKVEILMIDRFEFSDGGMPSFCSQVVEKSPLSMFACVNEWFIAKPEEFMKSEPELYVALSRLWNFNPVLMKIQATRAQQHAIERKDRNYFRRLQLHPVYYFTLISFFIGFFLLQHFYEKTVIYPLYVFLLVVLFALAGLLFIPVFKKRNIPVLKVPFAFFSLFGVGVNVVWIFLALNFSVLRPDTEKVMVFPYGQQKILHVSSDDYRQTIEIAISAELKTGLEKRISFKARKNVPLKFYIVNLKQGLFGYYVITDKSLR